VTGESGLRAMLTFRAGALDRIRQFFAARGVIEVETPALSAGAATDPNLASISAEVLALGGRHYLQTSPEHAMKQLLAEGSGDIFQIARVFRDGELGRWHQPEFSLLEWYRVGFDEFALMDEVFELLRAVLEPAPAALERRNLSYKDAFLAAVDVDPLDLDVYARQHLRRALEDRGIDVPAKIEPDALLDLALGSVVTTSWPVGTAVFLYDYPASQAALATIKPTDPPVAARFEVFVNGIELGNGFRELTDATEQRRRFESDLAVRRQAQAPEPPIDLEFLAALEKGLPDCAGVAIGLDRLLAVALGADSVAEVVSLPH